MVPKFTTAYNFIILKVFNNTFRLFLLLYLEINANLEGSGREKEIQKWKRIGPNRGRAREINKIGVHIRSTETKNHIVSHIVATSSEKQLKSSITSDLDLKKIVLDHHLKYPQDCSGG